MSLISQGQLIGKTAKENSAITVRGAQAAELHSQTQARAQNQDLGCYYCLVALLLSPDSFRSTANADWPTPLNAGFDSGSRLWINSF